MKQDTGTLKVRVRDSAGRKRPIKGARVLVFGPLTTARQKDQTGASEPCEVEPIPGETDQEGQWDCALNPGTYRCEVVAFVAVDSQQFVVRKGDCVCRDFDIPVGFDADVVVCREDSMPRPCRDLITAGTLISATLRTDVIDKGQDQFRKQVEYRATSNQGVLTKSNDRAWFFDTTGLRGVITMKFTLSEVGSPSMEIEEAVNIAPQPTQSIAGDVSVTMRRTATTPTPDLPLWTVIRSATGAISFNNYKKFMDNVMCGKDPDAEDAAAHCDHKSLPYPGVDAYSLVKCATEVFLMAHCGVSIDFRKLDFSKITLDPKTLLEEQGRYGRNINETQINQLWNEAYLVEVNGGTPVKTLPYLALIRSRLGEVPLKDGNGAGGAEVANCFGILRRKLEHPCLLELIWSYWHEEGMLVQTMKAISMRFQNKRGRGDRDPLMRFDIDPLRPLGNLLWGYIQDEQHRLTIPRRLYEYAHHYGFTLQGRAVPEMRAVDSRSKFLEGFHNLLYLCTIFFEADDDTTKIADGFPVMNAIREVHLLLAEGAHNQFGDLPSTARQEMLIEQWLLARPEMREFLGGRIMVPYSEVWMDRVDTVKRVQGWTDTTITDFHDLAVFGEQLLLSIRWGHWSDIHDPAHSANWARYWRPEIQSYIHSYRAVTGIDLTAEATGPQVTNRDVQPSVHLRRRLEVQQAQRPVDNAAPAVGSPRRTGAGRNNGGQAPIRAGGSREMEFTEDLQ